MRWQRRAWGVTVALVVAAVGGCNLIFGVTGGSPEAVNSTGGGGGGRTTSASTTTTSTTTTSSTSSTSGVGTGGAGTGGSVDSGVLVTPATTTMLALTTLTFTATAGDAGAGQLTWTVDEAGGGTVVPTTGAYTAPAAAGTYHLRATTSTVPAHYGEATITVVSTVPPVILVPSGELADATGNGSQSHLAYAEGAKQWWLFHDPSGSSQLATAYSADFATWSAGGSITLPYPNSAFGRDLAVAYRQINGADVVHLSQVCNGPFVDGGGGPYGRYHIRATLSAGQIQPGTPYLLNEGGGLTPDGSATVILPNGTVVDGTGDQSTPYTPPLAYCGGGDLDTYTSGLMDDGSATLDDMQFPSSPQVVWCVPDVVQARQLVAVGDSAVQLHVDGANAPPLDLLVEVRSTTGAWSPFENPQGSSVTPPSVFGTSEGFDLDDWTATVLGPQVHVVRRVAATGAFEHRILGLTGSFVDPITSVAGGAIPAMPTLPASGLFLAPYGDGLVLLALGPDAGITVVYTAYDGSSWSAWSQLVASGVPSTFLSGYAPGGGAKPAVIWTQEAGSSYAIAGALLP